MFYSDFPEYRKCNYGNGWKCNNGECIDAEWVCDGEYQCEFDNFNDPDDSDEIEGCKLYSGTYDQSR